MFFDPRTIILGLAWLMFLIWLIGLGKTVYAIKQQKPLELRGWPPGTEQPLVSVIVPARNEGGRILEKSVSSMLAQEYRNLEVIVLNDRSTDNTAEILAKIPFDKLRVIAGRDLAPGWLGKPHALQQAYQASKGEWILATDADIVFAPCAVSTSVEHAERLGIDALTLIPHTQLGSFWEKAFMYVFAWFCVQGMPAHKVNDPNRSESMGVGNFFMLRRDVMQKIDGFECVKNDVAEDLKLGEYLKKNGYRLRIDYAPDLLQTRMYSGLGEIWAGFSKNFFSGMKFSVFKTLLGGLSVLVFAVLPLPLAMVAFAAGHANIALPLFLSYLVTVLILFILHRKFRGAPAYAIFAPLGFGLFLAILFNSAYCVISGKGVTWKGRPIYERGGVLPPS
jgi:chlorobactene glucosyltransferase